jgi:hypothetical protein
LPDPAIKPVIHYPHPVIGAIIRRIGAAALGLALAGSLSAQSLTTIQPGAAMPGTSTTLLLNGAELRDVTGLWTSFPATAEFPGTGETNPAKLTCKLTLPANAPVGIGGLRVVTKKGISSLQLFMVDDLPTVASGGKNRSRAAAQPITLPVAVEGACDEGVFDYYKFSAKAGQVISVEVVAQRLGSKLDPVVRLLDANGRELAYSDDDPGIGSDARFMHKVASKGEYYLEVRDLSYQGGSQHRYRLRIGDFPLATVPFPMGVKPGGKTDFILGGRGLESAKPVSASLSVGAKALQLAVKNPGGRSSGFVSAVAASGEEFMEVEPNDLPALGNQINVPATVNGRFVKPKDRDYFQFKVEKGERIRVTAVTRALGSPSELLVRVQKPDGTVLADASEGLSTNTFAEGGTYQLLVEDLSRRGGPDQGYRVTVEPYRGFGLSVEADKVEAPAGGSFNLKVTAARRDFKGPITLGIDGLGDATVEGNVIPEDKNEATLKVTVPARLKAGEALTFTVTGRAKIKDVDLVEPVSTLPALRSLFPTLPNPPVHLNGLIGLGVTEPPAPAAGK